MAMTSPKREPAKCAPRARAIDEMQRRINRLVNDRTHMLAAISHDLRTPLTRLRANAIADVDARGAFERDIAEMEEMIDAALGDLRENSEQETSRPSTSRRFYR